MSNPVRPGFNQRWREPGFFLFSDKAGYLIIEILTYAWIENARQKRSFVRIAYTLDNSRVAPSGGGFDS